MFNMNACFQAGKRIFEFNEPLNAIEGIADEGIADAIHYLHIITSHVQDKLK